MKHFVSRMSSYFPNRWPLSYLNLTKIMKTYIRRQQHKKVFKHQDIKQKEPPQKYRLGTISNTKLLAGLKLFKHWSEPVVKIEAYHPSYRQSVDKQTFDLTDFHFHKEHSSACKIIL